MLKGINPILTGELLMVLSDMGHGDEIVIADGNFPAYSHSSRYLPYQVPSADAVEVLGAILEVFPLEDEEDALQFIVESIDEAEEDRPLQAILPVAHFGRSGLRVVQVTPLQRHAF